MTYSPPTRTGAARPCRRHAPPRYLTPFRSAVNALLNGKTLVLGVGDGLILQGLHGLFKGDGTGLDLSHQIGIGGIHKIGERAPAEVGINLLRSEERRVGKEGRSR